jgi:hypothetical protein
MQRRRYKDTYVKISHANNQDVRYVMISMPLWRKSEMGQKPKSFSEHRESVLFTRAGAHLSGFLKGHTLKNPRLKRLKITLLTNLKN